MKKGSLYILICSNYTFYKSDYGFNRHKQLNLNDCFIVLESPTIYADNSVNCKILNKNGDIGFITISNKALLATYFKEIEHD